MSVIPDTPLSIEAQNLFNRIKPFIDDEISQIKKIPVSVLVWGPNPTISSKISNLRVSLRSELRLMGHAAFFSEELCDFSSQYSVRIQQLAQAQKFDLVVSLPSSYGAIGEAHDFAADKRVHAKLLLFLNKQYENSYSAQSLKAVSSLISCQIGYYENEDDLEIVKSIVFTEVEKIREGKYLLSGRY
jgi:hypothetical protein